MVNLSAIHSPDDLKNLSFEELNLLCPQIRERIIQTVSQNGGHLSSNLGTVELTLALHKVFHAPKDKIIFDVGHQSYTHKLLTGRQEIFSTLRKKNGMSGFPNREESIYDPFTSGHASNAISAALGYARAQNRQGESYDVVAVVGDGALTGGMCYEALNDAGNTQTPLLVILNDNAMSISPNVGAISRYLTRLRTNKRYFRAKKKVERLLLSQRKHGENVYQALFRLKFSLKHLFLGGELFEQLGFIYIGPVDGHNIEELTRTFERAKDMHCPVLIHVLTEKGKGYLPAQKDPSHFHGLSSFDIRTGKSISANHKSNAYYVADTLLSLAEKDEKVVAVSAAMQMGTGFSAFAKKYPRRFYDVGIAEEHAITMSAGMALGGLYPYVGIYSTFLQRGYDQLLEDVALQKAPLTLLVDRGGVSGEDGCTHQGVFDLSFLTTCPNFSVLAPGNVRDLQKMILWAREQINPVAIRYPKSYSLDYTNTTPILAGKSALLRKGTQLVLLGIGAMVGNCLKAAELLQKEGFSCMVIDARFVKPLDEVMLRAIATLPIVVVEDNVLTGGFGQQVAAFFANTYLHPALRLLAFPDAFIPHGTREELLKEYHLDPEGIKTIVLDFIHQLKERETLCPKND